MTTDTKARIEQKFLELLNEKPISQIDVKEISREAGVNRNTFYYHYKNIPDLTESVVKGLVDEILAKYPPRFDTLEECFMAAIRIARENKRIIDHIYHSANRAIFERHLWHICEYSMTEFVDSFPQDEYMFSEEERQIVKDFLKFECFGFALDWINNGMPGDVGEKVRKLVMLLVRGEVR